MHRTPADGNAPRDVFTPTSLNRLVRDLLDQALPALWVEGEISNLARPASGHVYFSLKDAAAQIRCAMFRPRSVGLRFVPRDGSHVMLRGRIGLYEPRGDYQLIVETMEEAGEGALRREYERLRQQLAAEGLFDAARKRALPRFARRIGILSSPSGAAVRDVLSVLGRRFPLAEVELLPVPVQGKDAAAAIGGMLERAQRAARHDVLLLTRGGGSLEDLWAFNDEALARAIAASSIPIVAAIGHEVDFTLAEFAADVRAATPSVAAELLVPEASELRAHIVQRAQRMERCIERGFGMRAQRLDQLAARLRAQRPERRLERSRERMLALRARLLRAQSWTPLEQHLRALDARLRAQRPDRRLGELRARLAHIEARLAPAIGALLATHRNRGEALARALNAVGPLATLERGYAILFAADGSILRSAHGVARGATVVARLADGVLSLRHEGEA